ncbi:MAG: radical SAM protein [Deltaproteobacteria bacterium]|nr:radical SAM protein [Deltaproteobacteria bacterium]
MNYDGNIIRPPSEADSIILQVTVGCSHNHCTFCGAYKDKQFRIRSEEEIAANIGFAARYCTHQHKVFLADGDALILSQKRLTALFRQIRTQLPQVRRISLYGNAKAIRSKNPEQLQELKGLGLDRIYMGLESGNDAVLSRVRKGETADSMINAAQKVASTGIFLSVTVLLGLGGREMSQRHARATGRVLSAMAPRQIAALTLMPLAGTPLGDQVENGDFLLPDALSMLKELKEMVTFITCDKVQFMANHASNYLPISGRLGRDKKLILTTIDQAMDGRIALTPEFYRAL